MADFFNQEELKNIVLTKEHDIQNVVEFSRQNPNITLASFERREESQQQPQSQIDLSKLPRFENNVMPNAENEVSEKPSIHEKHFKTQKDRALELKKARAKLYISMFFICTFVITAFVIYNLVSTIILSNKASNNLSKIKDLRKQIEQLTDNENQPAVANFEIPKDLNL